MTKDTPVEFTWGPRRYCPKYKTIIYNNGRKINRWLPCENLHCVRCGPVELKALLNKVEEKRGNSQLYLAHTHIAHRDTINRALTKNQANALKIFLRTDEVKIISDVGLKSRLKLGGREWEFEPITMNALMDTITYETIRQRRWAGSWYEPKEAKTKKDVLLYKTFPSEESAQMFFAEHGLLLIANEEYVDIEIFKLGLAGKL